MILSCGNCGGLYATENMESFAGTPCQCKFAARGTERDRPVLDCQRAKPAEKDFGRMAQTTAESLGRRKSIEAEDLPIGDGHLETLKQRMNARARELHKEPGGFVSQLAVVAAQYVREQLAASQLTDNFAKHLMKRHSELADVISIAVNSCKDVTKLKRFSSAVDPVRWVESLQSHLESVKPVGLPAVAAGPTQPCPFKVGDRVRYKKEIRGSWPEATVTELTERGGFKYEYDEAFTLGTRLGVSKGGECYETGLDSWELAGPTNEPRANEPHEFQYGQVSDGLCWCLKAYNNPIHHIAPAALSAEPASPPFTQEQHHELCLGVMARCYPFVNAELKQAIREGVESAQLLGLPVDCRNLEKGGPLFTGGHA